MISDDFFHLRGDFNPMIYAYTDRLYPGFLKVGYTERNINVRVGEQYPVKRPDGDIPYTIVLRESALYPDGSSFRDGDVHRVLERRHFYKQGEGEWFKCSVDDVKAAIIALKTHSDNLENRTQDFPMRAEQAQAVKMTKEYFESVYKDGTNKKPKFLWNAKMRFGKTFTAYQLAKAMDFKRILILTFKPAVASAWKEDLLTHIDFEGWQFITRPTENNAPKIDEQYQKADKSRPIVCFGSFQDFLDKTENGGIKAQHMWVRQENWDLVIFDEYHFGAWKDSAKKLFEQNADDIDDVDLDEYNSDNALNETWLPITSKYYLYLSGTPFKALNSGEFIEEQVFNWTYSDEQKAKEIWDYSTGENPYLSLPKMIMMTYKIPDSIEEIAKQGEFNEFDLNVFFSAEGKGKNAQFKYKDYVQKWLDLIRGSYLDSTVKEMQLGAEKPPMPFSDTRLLSILTHTLWLLPDVASCQAMYNLLNEKQNTFYHDYKINVCAGPQAGIGIKALEPVRQSMEDPFHTKTITLTCGKLTTGVTIKPWSGVFMLRNLKSPETYFQTAFRAQNPWVIDKEDGTKEILKKECYVFDFAVYRALKQISDYSCKLNVAENNPEKKVSDFINFLPILAYDGSAMRQINAAEILDITTAGTTGTLLARRWESALLVHVTNEDLARLLACPEAMDALMKIEGFRSLNKDIETIINKSEKVKKAKNNKEKLTEEEKRELTEDEKEYQSKRKMIRDKLIKFATRIPIFMYLTDYRENSLRDVITKLEPELFIKVTGLTIKDFELLVSLNIFDEALMNDAVYKFRRYEDSSLEYTGINRFQGQDVGLYSTVLSREDYDMLAGKQADSMSAEDLPTIPESAVNIVRNTENNKPKESAVPSEPQKPAETTEKKTFNPNDLKVGRKVFHKAFGEGMIVIISGQKITVSFGREHKEMKVFTVPFAFNNGFLEFID